MSEKYLYPKNLDLSEPLSPELLELWNEAYRVAAGKRNRMLLWFLPFAAVMLYLIFKNIGDHSAVVFYAIAGVVVVLTVVGWIRIPGYTYTVSEDRSSAQIILRREFANVGEKLVTRLRSDLEPVSLGVEGCARAIINIIRDIMILFFSIWPMPFWVINDVFWLNDYRELIAGQTARSAVEPKASHVRGTDVQPSVKLSGTGPGGVQLSVLGDRISLHADGSITVGEGVAFNPESTFEGVPIGELVLTRQDKGLLRVKFEGADHAFFYNGTSWSNV